MREVRGLLDSPDVILAAPLLLIYAHRQCKTVDKEAIQELEAMVKANRRSCTDKVSGCGMWVGSLCYLLYRHFIMLVWYIG